MIMLYFFVRYYELLRKNIDCRKKLKCLLFFCGLVDIFMILLEEDVIVIVLF